MKGGSKVAKPTKKNIVRGRGKGCKLLKGGRAGCYIREKGKIVFRMTTREKLAALGITMVGGKRLPGFAGGKKRTRQRRTGRKRTGCKTFRNGRRGCYTSKGFRIVG